MRAFPLLVFSVLLASCDSFYGIEGPTYDLVLTHDGYDTARIQMEVPQELVCDGEPCYGGDARLRAGARPNAITGHWINGHIRATPAFGGWSFPVPYRRASTGGTPPRGHASTTTARIYIEPDGSITGSWERVRIPDGDRLAGGFVRGQHHAE